MNLFQDDFLNLYKLSLIVDCENIRAINVYKKVGFQEEGRLRHEFFVNGEYRDVFRMAIFQPNYLAQRNINNLLDASLTFSAQSAKLKL